MKLFGSISELASAIFRSNNQTITLNPPAAPAGSRILTLPDSGGTGATTIADLTTSQTFTGKTIAGASNTLTVLAGSQLSGQVPSTNGGTGVSNAGTLTYGANNITVTTSGTTSLTVPTSGTVATLAGSEALTNKNLASSTNTLTGATAGSFTNTGTITLPTSSDTLVGKATSDVLTNKTIASSTNTITSHDNKFTLQDNADATKVAVFECSGITTGTTRTFTFPDNNGTLITSATGVDLASTQSLSNKSFSTSIGAPDGSVTVPSLAFTSDADGTGTGLYRVGANSLGFTANGVAAGSYDSTAAWTLGASAGGDLTHTLQSNGLTRAEIKSAASSSSGLKLSIGGSTKTTFGADFGNSLQTGSTNGDAVIVSTGNLRIGDGTTIYGTVSNAGVWTIGPAAGGSNTNINISNTGELKVATTSAITNGNNVDVGVYDTATFVGGIGAFKNAANGNSNGYISLKDGGATANYLWFSNSVSGNLITSQTSGNIGTNTGTVVGTQTSDIRLKDNISDIQYGLYDILRMRPIRYTYKYDTDKIPKLGFAAQEMQSVIPESVYQTGEMKMQITETLAMEYVQLIPVLVRSIQELKAELDACKRLLQ